MRTKQIKKGGELESETENKGFWSKLTGLFGNSKPVEATYPTSEVDIPTETTSEPPAESSPGVFDKIKGWFQSKEEVQVGGMRKHKKTKSKLRKRALKTRRTHR
jgi:hypothetical protein